MDLNFRRAGGVFYRPSCASCDECRMIRLPVDAFRASRSQRRCWQRNADLEIRVESAVLTEEKLQLYRRYLADRHDGQMTGSAEEFREFLYTSPIRTHELSYRLAGRLVAVGVVDIEPRAVSAVYCYYDPNMPRRSLGVLNVLHTIELCRKQARPYLYLGFFIKDCQAMNYKANYRPAELLQADGRWVPIES
jgi:arginine-tRNA-protein transferase